jgi:beta-glucanase (GH16 family)
MRQGNAAGPQRRRRRTAVVAVTVLAGAVGLGGVFAGGRGSPTGAADAVPTQTLYNRQTISLRSGDGCELRPVSKYRSSKARRQYVCTLSGPVPVAVAPGPNTLNNGDRIAVISGDGCALKESGVTGVAVKQQRDLSCTLRGTGRPVASSPPTAGRQPPESVTSGATWTTFWSDEFTGEGVDPAKWSVPDDSNFGHENGEDQCYRRANATATGGTLRLTAQRETVTECGTNPHGGRAYFFTSGMVTTRVQGDQPLKMKFRHGYAEVQMRVPRGNFYWPAFWLVGAADGSSPAWPAYGEVDVAEIYGSRPDVSESNFYRSTGSIGARDHHVGNPRSKANGVNVNPPNPLVTGATNAWHRYGINWTANRLDWYIDGVLVRTYRASSKADRKALSYEKSIILNLALGGSGPRSSDHGFTGNESRGTYVNGNLSADIPGVFEVDYVRIWQP